MNTPSLSVYLFGHNLESIKYPYIASINSALWLTQFVNGYNDAKVYYCNCDSTDDTLVNIYREFIEEVECGDLVILEHPWGDKHDIQVRVCNFILDKIGTSTTYAMKLDADEVVHEDSFFNFSKRLEWMNDNGLFLGRPHYTHALDSKREFDFIYRSRAVISRTGSRIRYTDNDACALGGYEEWDTDLEIVHLGKWGPGREREALAKEVSFTKLYGTPFGFPDPRVTSQVEQGYLDYDKVFEHAKQHGEIRPFTGTFPKFVKPWIEEMERREVEFRKELEGDNFKKAEVEKWWE